MEKHFIGKKGIESNGNSCAGKMFYCIFKAILVYLMLPMNMIELKFHIH